MSPLSRVRTQPALVALALLGAVYTREAHAHFKQMEPACYSQQDLLGSPQKSAPCGQDDPGVTIVPTNAVTVYRTGDMLTLTLRETVYHPGHYRISIAQNMAGLPADSVVTPGTTACGSTPIDPNPTLPVIADGVLQHAAPFSGVQSIQIPLPPNFTCTNCVMQITEFMSEHGLNNPGGCFYHHCAMVSVLPPGVDSGTYPVDSGSPDAGTLDATAGDGTDGGTTPPSTGSCSCRTPATPSKPFPALAALSALGLALALRRTRR